MKQPDLKTLSETKVRKRKTKLEVLQAQYSFLPEPKGWLPINLDRDILDQIFRRYWKYKSNYNIEKAVAFCTLLIINRYKVKDSKRLQVWHNGFAHIFSTELREWIGKDYIKYIKVLSSGGIIEVHKGYLQGEYPKSYKFINSWLTGHDKGKQFRQIRYEDYNLKLKAFRIKIANWEETRLIHNREPLIQFAKEICLEFDIEGLKKFLYKKRLRKYESIHRRELQVIQYSQLNEFDRFWATPKDKTGFRLHTPFTIMKKEFRQFIRINGETAAEIDITNSQIYFFACLCIYCDIAYEMLKDEWNENIGLMECIKYLNTMYQNNADLQLFTELAFKGQIYEFIQRNIQEDMVISRPTAKKKIFYIIFSDNTKWKGTRAKVGKLFPTVIKVTNELNKDDRKLISRLMQRFESKLMIDNVAVQAYNNRIGKFVTVHDSFICAASEIDAFKNHIQNVFREIGLPIPVLESKILK